MKRIMSLILPLFLCLLLSMGVSAASAPRLLDEADLLSDAEESTLLAALDEISHRQMVDIVVCTTVSLGDASAMDSADNLFEQYQYGMDEDRSCILLLVSTEYSDWHITTAGYGITAVTDVGLTYLAEQFIPHLSNGEYMTAFTVYAETCDELLDRARAGDPYDEDDLPKEPFPAVRNFIVCLIIGLLSAWIIVGKQKAQLFSVRKQAGAKEYTKTGSLRVTEAKDFFLYRTVNRVEKADSESGGSSTHRTKSGTTVGGGGGKF